MSENCIGVDLTKKGEIGKFGNQKGKVSQAEYQSMGDDLHRFHGNMFDFIVAKHNLEHYENPLKTLEEWKRVLKRGGKIGVIVPDNRFVNSKALDPTHYYDFDLLSLKRIFLEAGFKIKEEGIAIPHWSIYLIAEK